MELPEPEPGTAQTCGSEGQDPTSKLKVLPLQLSFSPWDGQHDCDPTGTLSPLSHLALAQVRVTPAPGAGFGEV